MMKTFLILFSLSLAFFTIIPNAVEAAWIKFSDPVLIGGASGSWDSNHVGSPFIQYDGQIWKMWYQGHDGQNWRIGYATSNDGINWQKNPSYLIDITDQSENGVHDPKIIKEGNAYKMWNVSLGPLIDVFHINYSFSSDGLDWHFAERNVLPPTLIWEDAQGISHPFVMSENNIYKMWYSANGHLNGIQQWRIGYATSNDGINWTKNPDPILTSSQEWESEVSAASVFQENGEYTMLYHGRQDLGLAHSTDGINWTKDPNNPIISHGDTFDSSRALNAFLIKKDNTYYIYYTGIDSQGSWRIGLATSEPLPSLSPTPSPTPTDTPTPTSTPVATPTPSPAGTGTSPIIIAVGMGASWSGKDFAACNLAVSHQWKMTPFISVYDRLINTLKIAGLVENRDFYVYTYDWRQVLPSQAGTFQSYITKVLKDKPPGTKATIVAHGFGGLVVRSYLDKNPSTHGIDRLLTIGTPHRGAVSTYPLWANGQLMDEPLVQQALLGKIINHCKNIRGKKYSRREVVQNTVPSIQQLLPIFPYIRRPFSLLPESQMLNRNNWLLGHPIATDMYATKWQTLSGHGEATLLFLEVISPTVEDLLARNWLDGKPVGKVYSSKGDNAVLSYSSTISPQNTHDVVISANHLQLLYSDEGIRNILSFLNLGTAVPTVETSVAENTSTTALSISTDLPAEMFVQPAKQKSTVASQDNLLILYDADPGILILTVAPETSNTYQLYFDAHEKGQEPQSVSLSLKMRKNRKTTIRIHYRENGSNTIKATPQ